MLHRTKQTGFAIVSALFLIVVLSFLGISMARIFSSGQQAINQDITSLQSYLAGQSSLQWGMYQAVFSNPTGTPVITFSNSGLTDTTASVTFNSSTILGTNYYTIRSTAGYGLAGNPEYSRRNLELRFVP